MNEKKNKSQALLDMARKVYFIYNCINMMAQCKVFIGKGNKKAFLPTKGWCVYVNACPCVYT